MFCSSFLKKNKTVTDNLWWLGWLNNLNHPDCPEQWGPFLTTPLTGDCYKFVLLNSSTLVSRIPAPPPQRHGSIFGSVRSQPFSNACSNTTDLWRLEMSVPSVGKLFCYSRHPWHEVGIGSGFGSTEKSSTWTKEGWSGWKEAGRSRRRGEIVTKVLWSQEHHWLCCCLNHSKETPQSNPISSGL